MKQEAMEAVKTKVDVAAAGTTLLTVADVLPSISAVLSTIWLLIRIWETDTVRGLFGKKPLSRKENE